MAQKIKQLIKVSYSKTLAPNQINGIKAKKIIEKLSWG